MKQSKLYYFVIVTTLSLCIFSSGCSKNALNIEKLIKSNPDLKFALVKTPGQTETYRLITFAKREVTIEGPARDNAIDFLGGQTSKKVQIVFDSEVEGIDSDGNIIEKITIKEFKYISILSDNTIIDFDSSKKMDPNDALSVLVGQYYTIEISPQGQVIEVSGTDKILAELKGFSINSETARKLVSEVGIKARHNIPLPDANDNTLEPEKTWSNVVGFDFDQMGFSSFERTYKLDKIIKNFDAIISMNAIPSVEGMRDTEVAGSPAVPPMTDVRQTYSGSMEFDISAGTLFKYQEELINTWLVVPPSSNQDGPPSVLNMTATRLYDIEKIK